jgi:hypothetical protein
MTGHRRQLWVAVLFVGVIASGLGCQGAGADGAGDLQTDLAGSASSKAAAAISTVTVCANGNSAPCTTADVVPQGVWQDVMKTTIKTSNVSDLFVDASMVTGLYTYTAVKGNNTGSQSTARAMGGVKVRVVIDGTPGRSYPDTTGDGITFNQRIQTMTANLGNIFTDCFAQGGTTGTGCTLTPAELSLALDTTSAHSFGFILPNVGSGMHTVTVQAQVNTDATGENGGVAISNALYGMSSVVIEATRMVNSFSF